MINNLATLDDHPIGTKYDYNLDGGNYQISDGGGDMYDGGNRYSPMHGGNTSNTDLAYDSAITNYYTTRFAGTAVQYPTMMMAAPYPDANPATTFGYHIEGNTGADNISSSSQNWMDVYTAHQIGNYYVWSSVHQVGGTTDPSINHVFIAIANTADSVTNIQKYSQYSGSQTDVENKYYTFASDNALMLASLLAKSSGVKLTLGEAQAYVDAVVNVVANA